MNPTLWFCEQTNQLLILHPGGGAEVSVDRINVGPRATGDTNRRATSWAHLLFNLKDEMKKTLLLAGFELVGEICD